MLLSAFQIMESRYLMVLLFKILQLVVLSVSIRARMGWGGII